MDRGIKPLLQIWESRALTVLPTPSSAHCLPSSPLAATPAATPEVKTVDKTKLESVWKVVVLNDPINLMSYVVLVFKRVFGFDETRARTHMLEVHEKGRSVVWSGPRERAETYVYTLQEWHLSAILEQDESH